MQRASEVEEKKPRSLVTDGLIVAGATAGTYLITFAFEYGYCSYFGVPGFVIEPSTGTILFAAFIISATLISLVEASYVPRKLLAAIPWPKLRVRLVLVAFIWGLPALMGVPFNWHHVLSSSIWTLLLLGGYLYALIFMSGSISERISHGEKNIDISHSAWDGPMKIFGVRAVGFMLIFYACVIISWAAGTISARFQEGFIVLKSTPDLAVIKRYGDRFIAIRYAGTPARATGEFRVVDREKDMEFLNLDKLTIGSIQK